MTNENNGKTATLSRPHAVDPRMSTSQMESLLNYIPNEPSWAEFMAHGEFDFSDVMPQIDAIHEGMEFTTEGDLAVALKNPTKTGILDIYTNRFAVHIPDTVWPITHIDTTIRRLMFEKAYWYIPAEAGNTRLEAPHVTIMLNPLKAIVTVTGDVPGYVTEMQQDQDLSDRVSVTTAQPRGYRGFDPAGGVANLI